MAGWGECFGDAPESTSINACTIVFFSHCKPFDLQVRIARFRLRSHWEWGGGPHHPQSEWRAGICNFLRRVIRNILPKQKSKLRQFSKSVFLHILFWP